MDTLWQIAIGVACVGVVFVVSAAYGHYVEYKKSTGGKKITLKFFAAYLAFIAGLVLIVPASITLAIYRQTLSLLLKIRHGPNFGGFLEGTDAIHTVDEDHVSKNIGNILIMVNFTGKNFHDTIKSAVLKRLEETSIKTPKLWYTWQHSSGLTYYLKNQLTPQECLKKLEPLGNDPEKEITKADLMRLISKSSNAPLPRNHLGLWDVLIGTQPVKWKPENPHDTATYYPVILRIHHCLSDATQLLMAFVRIFGDAKPPSPRQNCDKTIGDAKSLSLTRPVKALWSLLKLVVKGFYVLVMIPPILLVQGMIKAADENSLHGETLSGERHMVFGVEESPNYIQVIKRIKKRIPGTSFSEVLIAAISASLGEYFEKTSTSVPKAISAMVPVFPGSSKLAQFLPQDDVQKIVCRNKFSLAFFDLPITVNSKEVCTRCNSVKTRLASVKKESSVFKESIDFQVNYMILSLFGGILPLSLRKTLSKRIHCTCMISIIPAPPAITVLGGYPIQDPVFWVPNREPIGVGFSFFSYDGRFQIGLIVDKALIPEEKDVQGIVDGIYKYLDLMNVETDCSRV